MPTLILQPPADVRRLKQRTSAEGGIWAAQMTSFMLDVPCCSGKHVPEILSGVWYSIATGLQTAHVYFSPLSVGCRPIGRPTYRSTVDRLSADSRPTVDRPIGRQSTDCLPTVDRQSVDLSADSRPTVEWLSADSRSTYRPTVDRLSVDTQSADCRSTVDRQSTDCRRVGFRQKSFSTISRMKQGLVFLVELAQTPDSTVFGSKPVLMSHWKAREWLRCGQVTRVLSWVNFGGVALYSKIIRCWSQTDLSLIQKEHSKPASSFPVFATQVGKPIEI